MESRNAVRRERRAGMLRQVPRDAFYRVDEGVIKFLKVFEKGARVLPRVGDMVFILPSNVVRVNRVSATYLYYNKGSTVPLRSVRGVIPSYGDTIVTENDDTPFLVIGHRVLDSGVEVLTKNKVFPLEDVRISERGS